MIWEYPVFFMETPIKMDDLECKKPPYFWFNIQNPVPEILPKFQLTIDPPNQTLDITKAAHDWQPNPLRIIIGKPRGPRHAPRMPPVFPKK